MHLSVLIMAFLETETNIISFCQFVFVWLVVCLFIFHFISLFICCLSICSFFSLEWRWDLERHMVRQLQKADITSQLTKPFLDSQSQEGCLCCWHCVCSEDFSPGWFFVEGQKKLLLKHNLAAVHWIISRQ